MTIAFDADAIEAIIIALWDQTTISKEREFLEGIERFLVTRINDVGNSANLFNDVFGELCAEVAEDLKK